ncbi:transporter substrate-binding domain-containing protein [Domibacillus sp. PGB-M46]|uniref:transporter substrate-binding domain-containing protein n=1 Tax=Domibacillus sp. PGB-M46 TaxID=2910255 RepID=UPI001F56B376|nr:transporter substrate-binding domain-containing protein [Domibacillus sp. PGB-M46]MCI2255794.1 transporter substrate-binding domain-containing protein [Domibacillus sp. PGB-M46]
MKKPFLRLPLVCIIFSLMLSACSSSNAGSSQESEATGSTYDEIKSRGKVIVGTESAFEPFEFIKDGKIVGYGSDILSVMVDDLDVELEQLDLPFQGILPGLDAKKFDFVATSVTITPERAEKYDFTVPIAEGTMAVLKRKGDTSIQKPEDISGKVVGTQLGSGMLQALQTFDKDLKAEGNGVKEIKEYVAFPEAYQELATGRIDAVVNTKANLAGILKKNPDTYEIVDTFGEPMWIAWAVRKGDKELLDYLNKQILELRDSGKLEEMQMKWFGFTMEIPDSGYLPE